MPEPSDLENYDVAVRLAQGRSAVDTVQRYVWACHQLGYQHADLTLHPQQLRDWYGTEDGMDLGALRRGCLALEGAVRASQEALVLQDRQLAQLSGVWQGLGGESAREFLRRHRDASSAVAAAVRTAADALITLREELWHAVTTKVDTAVAVEARAEGVRAEWLAAATTVTTGAGDRSAAAELVDGAVRPFVDSTVSTEWLSAMQTAVASINSAYERAVAEIEAEESPMFDVPGDLGPAWTPPAAVCEDDSPCGDARCEPAAPPGWSGSAVGAAAGPHAMPAAVPVAPAAASPPAPAPPAPAPPVSAPPAAPAEAPAPPLPAVPPPAVPAGAAAPPLGAMGAGMPDLGGGLSGLGQQFADALGGLLGGGGALSGGAAGGLPDLPESEFPETDLDDGERGTADEDPDAEGDEVDGEDEVLDPQDEGTDEATDETTDGDAAAVEEIVDVGEAAPADGPCEPAPPPTPPPPPAEPLPPAEPAADARTPCEIAADEVPQVGEPAE